MVPATPQAREVFVLDARETMRPIDAARLMPKAVAVVFCVLAGSILCAKTSADSIHMKTGTVIRTDKASIEGDAVVFEQYGSRVAIPLELVDRVVPDDHTGPVAITRDAPHGGASAGRSSVPESPDSGATANQSCPASATATDAPPPPEETKEYWQSRVRALYQQGEAHEVRLKELRRIEQAFLFSHRSTADSRRQIEEVQQAIEGNEQAKRDLKREARRKGVPPGWLRVRGITY
jgi:hypothetical protein